LPFLPVFSGGQTKFQPVYVKDIARLVEIISRNHPDLREVVDGKVIEAGGPDGKQHAF
jgi:NADH dehydrogenase